MTTETRTTETLLDQARVLSEKIRAAKGQDRYELHQQLHRTLNNMQRKGGRVPASLRQLDHDLLEAEIEDSFDNMPI